MLLNKYYSPSKHLGRFATTWALSEKSGHNNWKLMLKSGFLFLGKKISLNEKEKWKIDFVKKVSSKFFTKVSDCFWLKKNVLTDRFIKGTAASRKVIKADTFLAEWIAICQGRVWCGKYYFWYSWGLYRFWKTTYLSFCTDCNKEGCSIFQVENIITCRSFSSLHTHWNQLLV